MAVQLTLHAHTQQSIMFNIAVYYGHGGTRYSTQVWQNPFSNFRFQLQQYLCRDYALLTVCLSYDDHIILISILLKTLSLIYCLTYTSGLVLLILSLPWSLLGNDDKENLGICMHNKGPLPNETFSFVIIYNLTIGHHWYKWVLLSFNMFISFPLVCLPTPYHKIKRSPTTVLCP